MFLPIQQEVNCFREAEENGPSISIILPFEPKMSEKNELEYRLQRVIVKVQREIKGKYSEKSVMYVLDKLQSIISKLDFSTYKKSIALFVSPQTEKIYYLDIDVEEKVIIDSAFEIRNLVNYKKDFHSFLLLVISAARSRIYMGSTQQFLRISSVASEQLNEIRNDIPNQLTNYAEPTRRKENMLDKFLREVDSSLDIILQAYSLPLFVMGTYRAAVHFKKITRHYDHIMGFISGNADEANEQIIRKAVTPYIVDWKKVKQEDLLHQLDKAKEMNKLATGIPDVLKEACSKKGRLLVVEHNYSCNTWKVKGMQNNLLEKEVNDTPFLIEDVVDDIIEKVLESGGDVEFVEDGLLKSYMHIGLIKY